MNKRLTGLIPAAYTPMHADGTLKLELVPKMVDHMLAGGASGIYVCGSTGEGSSLTGTERRQVAEAFVKAAAGRLPVIIQVGHNSVRESRELAAHAQSVGADMISAHSPSYFKPGSEDLLSAAMAILAEGAPALPFYYYHIPSLTGVALDMVQFLELSAGRIPNLAGIKYTDQKLFEYQAARNCCDGRFDILWGCDEMLLSAMAVGARGAVGCTFNLIPALYHKIMAAFDAGDLDEARRCQYLSVQFGRIINRHAPLHTSLKAVMQMIGLECGGVRLPQLPLASGLYQKIEAELDAAGFREWMVKV